MKNKVIKLKTVEDICNVVNRENLDDFIRDFSSFLSIRIGIKESRVIGSLVEFDDTLFQWIDDGKHDCHLQFKSKTNDIKNN